MKIAVRETVERERGDCGKDSDCADGFTCGSNNCAWSTWGVTWSDDCCTAYESNTF